MKIEFQEDPLAGTITIMATIRTADMMRSAMPEAILREAASLIAQRLVSEKFQEISAGIDAQAIANLAVAESAAQIHKTLQEKIPSRVLEIERKRTEVYQRGIFGDMKRIA